jgi:hypothetical protein
MLPLPADDFKDSPTQKGVGDHHAALEYRQSCGAARARMVGHGLGLTPGLAPVILTSDSSLGGKRHGPSSAAGKSKQKETDMKNRNPALVLILSLITCGIYGIVWYVKTKEEMKSKGADIPTAILLIIPFVNLFWLWKYSSGVEQVTSGGFGAAVSFLLLLFTGPIGMAVVQSQFNKLAATEQAAPQEPAA